ncbi:MAG: cell division protein ZapA [Thermoanaerobacterales bacterium]|nr:cell division protein ZapA [Bacillota bacterium]MDI6907511.1 cell division protein ZapA [Thermoanaerobacterales bacterium]
MGATVQTSRVEVEIMGEYYVLRGDSSPEHIRELARRVDRMIREITSRNPRVSVAKAAVLAAINIADELKRLQESYDGLVKMIEGEREQ